MKRNIETCIIAMVSSHKFLPYTSLTHLESLDLQTSKTCVENIHSCHNTDALTMLFAILIFFLHNILINGEWFNIKLILESFSALSVPIWHFQQVKTCNG